MQSDQKLADPRSERLFGGVGLALGAAPEAGVAGLGAVAAPGLASSSTSQTENGSFVVDAYKSRLRKVAKGIMEAANLVQDELQEGGVRYRAAFCRLSYRPDAQFEPKQISRLVDNVRKWCGRRGYWFRLVWRFEFGEKSGRPHYHVIVWLPRGVTMPKWDKVGWWPHGFTNMQWARSPVGYIAKYAAKATVTSWEGFSTKGARWWGCSGLRAADTFRLRVLMSPAWVRKIWHAMGDTAAALKRLPFGWWRVGGWEFRSPWECVGMDPAGARVRFRGWDAWDFECAP